MNETSPTPEGAVQFHNVIVTENGKITSSTIAGVYPAGRQVGRQGVRLIWDTGIHSPFIDDLKKALVDLPEQIPTRCIQEALNVICDNINRYAETTSSEFPAGYITGIQEGQFLAMKTLEIFLANEAKAQQS